MQQLEPTHASAVNHTANMWKDVADRQCMHAGDVGVLSCVLVSAGEVRIRTIRRCQTPTAHQQSCWPSGGPGMVQLRISRIVL